MPMAVWTDCLAVACAAAALISALVAIALLLLRPQVVVDQRDLEADRMCALVSATGHARTPLDQSKPARVVVIRSGPDTYVLHTPGEQPLLVPGPTLHARLVEALRAGEG